MPVIAIMAVIIGIAFAITAIGMTIQFIVIVVAAFFVTSFELVILPSFVVVAVFLGALAIWIRHSLGNDAAFQQSIDLKTSDGIMSWIFNFEKYGSHWGNSFSNGAFTSNSLIRNSLYIAIAISFVVVVLQFPYLGYEAAFKGNTFEDQVFSKAEYFGIYSGRIVAAATIVVVPNLLLKHFEKPIKDFIQLQVQRCLASRFKAEDALLHQAMSAERQVMNAYSRIDISFPERVRDICRDVAFRKMKGGTGDLASELEALLTSLGHEMDDVQVCEPLVQAITDVERQLIKYYSQVGISVHPRATDICRQAIVSSRGNDEDTGVALRNILDSDRNDLRELRECVASIEIAERTFEKAKEAVIKNGSAILLEELDAINRRLGSGMITDALELREWTEAKEVLQMITERLELLKRAGTHDGERIESEYEPTTVTSDTTLEEAYKILNVGPNWPKNAIAIHVKALRVRYSVDPPNDENEKKRRNAALQQISAAWDIVERRRVD
jgi:hypothetical protein